MIITEKNLIGMMKEKEAEKVSTIYLNSRNIGSICLKNHFYRVEFLSLQHNSIKDISFLKNLPNLWYLDIRSNPIESYEVVNAINCFGFLGLSVEKYSEKKILAIKKLNVGIMNFTIDEYYKKGFMLNNPNIIKFNEEILYYYDKISSIAAGMIMNNNLGKNLGMAGILGGAPQAFARSSIDVSQFKSFSAFLNTAQGLKNNPHPQTTNSINSHSPNFARRVSYANTIFSNEKARNLSAFFNTFNTEVGALINNPKSLVNNLNPEVFGENGDYLKEERKKLKLLAQIFESLLQLNKNEKFVLRMTSNNNSNEKILEDENNSNNYVQDINPFSVKTLNFSYFKIKETFIQIIILTIMILFILQITGKEFSIVLIKYIFKNFLHLNLHTLEIKSFLDFDTEFLLGIYFEIYDNFREAYTGSNSNSNFNSASNSNVTSQVVSHNNSQIDLNENPIEINPVNQKNVYNVDKLKYEEIFKCLEMSSLILKCNVLNKTKPEATKIYSLKNDLEMRKVLINTTLIKLLDDKLKIFDPILNLIQYLNDFILFYKIDNVLLKDHTLQYRVFIEIKGLMFIHLNKKTKNNLIYNTLTDRKYTDHKYKRLGNKLFFIKNPIGKDKKEKEPNNVFNFLAGVEFNYNKGKKKEIGRTVDKVREKELHRSKDLYKEKENNYHLKPRTKIDKNSENQHQAKITNYQSENLNDEHLYLDKIMPKKTLNFFGVSIDAPDKEMFASKETIYSTNIPMNEMERLLRTTKINYKANDGGKRTHSLMKNPLLNNPPHEMHYINEEASHLTSKIYMKNRNLNTENKKASMDSYYTNNENSLNKIDYYRSPKTDRTNKMTGFSHQHNNSTTGSHLAMHSSTLQKSPRSLSELKKKATKYLTAKIHPERRHRDPSPSNLVLDTSKKDYGHGNGHGHEQTLSKNVKNIYDFKSNIKKLVHHWNENNLHVEALSHRDLNLSLARESEAPSDFSKSSKKKNSSQVDNYMTAQDIFNLFSIENKNEIFKSKSSLGIFILF
jgi:hypothetical protein